MDPEKDQGGGMMQSRIFGLPTIVWVLGAAVLAYLYFSHRSSQSAGSPSTPGGGGTATSGTTRIDKGAIQVTVTQNPQPKPPVWKREKGDHDHDKDDRHKKWKREKGDHDHDKDDRHTDKKPKPKVDHKGSQVST